jgi:hypothetical protein
MSSIYGKLKFVFLGLQTINGNRRLLFAHPWSLVPTVCTLSTRLLGTYIHHGRLLADIDWFLHAQPTNNPSSLTQYFATKCFYILYSIVIISEGHFYIPATPSLLHKLEWLEKAGVFQPMSGFIVQLECEWF